MNHRPAGPRVPDEHTLTATILWLAALPTVPTQDWCADAANRVSTLDPGRWFAVAIGMLDSETRVFRTESIGDAPTGQRPGPMRDTPLENRLAGSSLGLEQAPPQGVLGRASQLMPMLCAPTDPLVGIAPLAIQIDNAALVLIAHPIDGSYSTDQSASEPAASPDMLACALAVLARRAEDAFAAHAGDILWLTEREHEVLARLIEGRSVRAIADELGRSPHTVHDHVKSLHRKLDASSRGELIAKALGHADASTPPRLITPTVLREGAAAVTELKPAASERVADTTT